MLTKKGKYGLKAMLYLAQSRSGEPVLSNAIAEEHLIPKKFLDAILGDLRKAGFVYTKKGRFGGYLLAQSADQIMIGDIIRALDGPLAPIQCASKTRYRRCDDCTCERSCAVRNVMSRVRNAIAGVLDNCTLDELAKDRRFRPAGQRSREKMRRTMRLDA